jgi:hypothetical protein
MLAKLVGFLMASQSRRRGEVVAESDKARRGGDGLGRIATGWPRVRLGLLEADRERRVDAAGSWTCTGDSGRYP